MSELACRHSFPRCPGVHITLRSQVGLSRMVISPILVPSSTSRRKVPAACPTTHTHIVDAVLNSRRLMKPSGTGILSASNPPSTSMLAKTKAISDLEAWTESTWDIIPLN
eukprot:416316-Rhodomonas_salina.6